MRLTGGKLLLGMIHLPPLPGTPFATPASLREAIDTAVRSALALRAGGADGCHVQTADRVYGVADECDPARTTAMGIVVAEIRRTVGDDFPVGVQIMRNAARASLAVAKVAGGSFVRLGALVGTTLSPQGMVQANPLEVMEYRRKIDAWDVKVIADIDSMHFRWYGEELPVGRVARHARTAGADAVALCHPDAETALAKIAEVRAVAPELPVILAGHTDHDNAARLLAAADGAFVGTCWERDGWGSGIDEERVRTYVARVRGELG
ncbi:BtpA/SgcQ family protein [Nonomuraea sp. B5E05]|uniref:BtpA/SgcQ family protein n=1 Tax=Nonomuraea sp. B5E05 TaxID=3153569 RepID=UPI0032603F46